MQKACEIRTHRAASEPTFFCFLSGNEGYPLPCSGGSRVDMTPIVRELDSVSAIGNGRVGIVCK